MGRYSTLNADTKDLVNCLLPALAASFGLSDPIDIIPEDIRMRAWDCERRDHIKDQPEDDPRNWGVQFLKDLKAISRLKDGNLAVFQADLRAKVELHEEKHPWCRLSDIKELKAEYENPELLRKDTQSDEFESESSIDSYLEELHEPELPRGKKRKGGHEFYETRVQQKQRKCTPSPTLSYYMSTDSSHRRPPPPHRRRLRIPQRHQPQETAPLDRTQQCATQQLAPAQTEQQQSHHLGPRRVTRLHRRNVSAVILCLACSALARGAQC
jgi:hypothetical protein